MHSFTTNPHGKKKKKKKIPVIPDEASIPNVSRKPE
jgi:hypothetical protein